MTKTFPEVISGIRTAKKGVEVREDLAQMGEYCQQFTTEAGQRADAARDKAQGYAADAEKSKQEAAQTVQGIDQTKTDAIAAVQQAQADATKAVEDKQTAAESAINLAQTDAVQAVDDAKTTALQEVAASTEDAANAAQAANASKEAAVSAASASLNAAAASSEAATAASGSATAAATSESNAATSASNANAGAARAEAAAQKAEATVGTDKTFTVKGAPADAAATGEALGKKADASVVQDGDGQVLFYSKAEMDDKLGEKLGLSGGTMTGPLILVDGYDAHGIAKNAAAHNAMPPRFKNLGSTLTSEMSEMIAAGTFDDLFVGDYFNLDGNPLYIAEINRYINCGDTACTTNHIVLVPGNNLYNYHMNATNTTEGGYVGSDMYKNGLTQAKQYFTSAFGSSHILKYRQYLCNAVKNGAPSGGAWLDSTVELMSERMVYGNTVFAPMGDGAKDPWSAMHNYTIDKSQLALFRHAPYLICNRGWFWLRDVVSASGFALVDGDGNADYYSSSYANAVRPFAGIH